MMKGEFSLGNFFLKNMLLPMGYIPRLDVLKKHRIKFMVIPNALKMLITLAYKYSHLVPSIWTVITNKVAYAKNCLIHIWMSPS